MVSTVMGQCCFVFGATLTGLGTCRPTVGAFRHSFLCLLWPSKIPLAPPTRDPSPPFPSGFSFPHHQLSFILLDQGGDELAQPFPHFSHCSLSVCSSSHASLPAHVRCPAGRSCLRARDREWGTSHNLLSWKHGGSHQCQHCAWLGAWVQKNVT